MLKKENFNVLRTYNDICLPSFCARIVSARLRYSVVAPCRRNFGWRSLNELVLPTRLEEWLLGGDAFVSDSSLLPLSTMLAALESTSRGDSGRTGDRGLDISITWKINVVNF